MIELELDFSQEDVEFAERDEFKKLTNKIRSELKILIDSFQSGNVLKNGISVAIAGKPNAGKSSLLNTLLNEDKAIVSDIAGTTRDSIEDELIIKGYNFRFIDTAGIRKTKDKIENLGIKKTLLQANKSSIIIYLIDATLDINQQIKDIKKLEKEDQKKIIKVINKIDLKNSIKNQIKDSIYISAKDQNGLEELKEKILNFTNIKELSNNNTIITTVSNQSVRSSS